MSNGMLMTIVVAAKSGFGVLDSVTNKWLNPSDKALLKEFNVGHSYNVELVQNKGKEGKVYTNISKIVGDRGPSPDQVVAKPQVKAATPVAAPKRAWGKPASSTRDFDAEARGKSIHGLICAAIQSPKVNDYGTDEQLFAFVDKVVEYGMNKLFPAK